MTLRSSIEKVKLPAAPTHQRVGLHCVLFVSLAACVMTSGSQAQEKQETKKDAPAGQEQEKKTDADKKKEADRKAAIKKEAVRRQAAAVRNRVVRVQNQWTDENFDQWIFQQDRNPTGARNRLNSALVMHLEAIDRASQLTDAQRKKLQLAGRGDIKRFFDRYETVKQKFHLVKDDQQKMQQIWQDIGPLQTSWQAGLFDGDSLFYKSLHNTLTSEQRTRYDAVERERREFSHCASILQVVAAWEQSVPLRKAQRRELITLLSDQTKPPRKLGPYGYIFIMFQLSQLPEKKLKPIFDETQWKIIGRNVVQAKQWGQYLRTVGILGNDDEEADVQPRPEKNEQK